MISISGTVGSNPFIFTLDLLTMITVFIVSAISVLSIGLMIKFYVLKYLSQDPQNRLVAGYRINGPSPTLYALVASIALVILTPCLAFIVGSILFSFWPNYAMFVYALAGILPVIVGCESLIIIYATGNKKLKEQVLQ
jgi:hypothetical protein